MPGAPLLGAQESSQDYAPFGGLFNGNGIADPCNVTGKERDTGTWSDYFAAR